MWSSRRDLARLGALGFVVAVLAACGGGGSSGGSGSGTLLVVDTVPADGGMLNPSLPPDAVRSHEFRLFFSTEPDPATVLDEVEFNGLSPNVRFINRALSRVDGWAFLGGLDASGRSPKEVDPDIDSAWAEEIANDGEEVLRFIYDTDGRLSTPEALPPDQYTLVVTQQVTNKRGRPILEPFCGSFTSGPDTFAPVVRLTSPANGATDVDLDANFVFEFNESVVPSTVVGTPPPSALTVTATAVGGVPGGGPSLQIMGTIQQSQSNGCRFTFVPNGNLPGSSPGASVVVTATIANIVRDAAGNTMVNPSVTSFTMRQGPTISNNPIPPSALWFGSTAPNLVGVVGVNAVGSDPFNPVLLVETDGDGIPTPMDDNTVVPTSINDEIGTPVDMVLGDFILQTSGFTCQGGMAGPHIITNVPFPNPPTALPLGSSMCSFLPQCPSPPFPTIPVPNGVNADLGTYVYVADSDNNLIRVLNSNTSLEVDQLPVPDPAGVTITSNLETLLVTNFGTNSVSVFDVIQGNNTFIKEVTVNPTDPALAVGRGPKAIAAQPDNEDVMVLNTRDDSMSILSIANSFEVRKVIESNIGPDPVDVGCTWRQPPFIPNGGTQTWFAYITNRAGNSISVFESGPFFPTVIGPDDIKIVLQDSQEFSIRQPTRVHTDLATGIFGDGLFWVNSEDATVGHLQLTFIGPPPTSYFPNPAPNRVWGQSFVTQSFGRALDIAMGDNLIPCNLIPGIAPTQLVQKNNFGQVFPPIRGYVATGTSIRVFDATTSLDLGITIPLPGVNQVLTHWKQ